MKNKFYVSFVFTLLLLGCSGEQTSKESKEALITHDLSMYSEATEGSKRYCIEVPVRENESDYEVEIWAGKTIEVDCNQHKLVGNFKKEIVQGWGYPYYNFNTTGQLFGTRMHCPDQTLSAKFVRSASERIRYNSKLPIVVYCPKDVSIRYAIWSKNERTFEASAK